MHSKNMCTHLYTQIMNLYLSVYVHGIFHFFHCQLIANICFMLSKKPQKSPKVQKTYTHLSQSLQQHPHQREAVYAIFKVLKVIQYRTIYIYIQKGLVLFQKQFLKARSILPTGWQGILPLCRDSLESEQYRFPTAVNRQRDVYYLI